MIDANSKFIEVPTSDPDDSRRAKLLNVFLMSLSALAIIVVVLVTVLILIDNPGKEKLIDTLWSGLATTALADLGSNSVLLESTSGIQSRSNHAQADIL